MCTFLEAFIFILLNSWLELSTPRDSSRVEEDEALLAGKVAEDEGALLGKVATLIGKVVEDEEVLLTG